MPDPLLLDVIAGAFLSGEQTVQQIRIRASRALGRRWRWLGPLASRYLANFRGVTRPRIKEVVGFIQDDPGFREAVTKYASAISVVEWLYVQGNRMQPVPAATRWPIPPLDSLGALCEWLSVTPGELDWFADLKGLEYRASQSGKLRHYHYVVRTKGSGGVRLIEAPKARLKKLQQRMLGEILDKIPSHPAVHGFRKGRSIKTFVAPHVGQRVVLRMDIQDFFPSISGPRVQAFFRTAGYPEPVADALGALCTNVTPREVWRRPEFEFGPRQIRDAWVLYRRPHLPQGAPTSPALANVCTYRVDCRLSGLATAAGAVYTRYADDLAFSGGEEFERRVQRFSTHVAAILLEEGFSVNHRKTRMMRQGVRQHLAGLVANQKVNVIRADFDLLKATLTNCVRSGLESQNREGRPDFLAHLEGRVGFVEMINPGKGKRLRAILDRVKSS